ncbi:MAG: hypothetical protein KQ78_01790 [Candidatus Izimaplasma bacterium HR2]|nr:MAG: hypothetical protein KQ78_01790 [Candidatus Izimaplasma bacterium HR2]
MTRKSKAKVIEMTMPFRINEKIVIPKDFIEIDRVNEDGWIIVRVKRKGM